MSPEEREATLARMRERGGDPNSPGAGGGRGGFGGRGGGAGDATGGAGAFAGRGGPQVATAPESAAASRRSAGASAASAPTANAGSATTIDALFAPLPRTETVGRAWTLVENQLRPLRLRLGISDGQNTEVIDGDVKDGAEVVTNIVIAGQTTRPATTAFPGFGQPGRGGFPGGGFQGGGGGAARGGGR